MVKVLFKNLCLCLCARDSKSSDSFASVGSASTISLVTHIAENHGHSTVQQEKNLSTKFCVEHIVRSKPTNIVVYSESAVTLENVKAVLQETLNSHRLEKIRFLFYNQIVKYSKTLLNMGDMFQ